MTEVIGKNTPASAKVKGYIDEVERINAQIKELQDIRTSIYARAKSEGFATAGIKYVVKVRKMKPHQREEAENTRDIYMHAAGMANEPPLFRQIENLAKDVAGGEKLLESFKLLAPPTGHLIVTIMGKQVRIYRDKDGNPRSEDYSPPEPSAPPRRQSASAPVPPPPEVANLSGEQAEVLGRQAYRENLSIISNPFPHDDSRRPRWDRGWRLESGSDGMGEDD